jgi:hypothetical protein
LPTSWRLLAQAISRSRSSITNIEYQEPEAKTEKVSAIVKETLPNSLNLKIQKIHELSLSRPFWHFQLSKNEQNKNSKKECGSTFPNQIKIASR